MPYASLSKFRMHYFERGSGAERIVFVHGFQASGRIWQRVQESLPADAYQSIAVNNRGAGPSEALPNESDYGIPIFAADVFELITQLGWRDFTLVGHSAGGATVACFAVQHPELLKGLVLLDPSSPQAPEHSPDEIERLVDERIERILRERAAGSLDGIDAGRAAPKDEWLRLLAEDIKAAPEQRLRGTRRSMLSLRLGEAVGALPMPVLLAGGDADQLVPLENMLQTWRLLPDGAGLQIWHGIGHSPNVQIPEQVASVLRRFIEETIPTTRTSNLRPGRIG